MVHKPEKEPREVQFTVTVHNRYGTRIWPPEDDKDWMKVARTKQAESERRSFVYTKEMHNDGAVGFEQHLENITKKRE